MSNTYNRSKQIAKILSLLFATLLTTAFAYSQAPNTWTQKADFTGGARYYATGFAIGSKGYLGTGSDGVSAKKDFWEYDPTTDTWSQKADFGGTARGQALGISIGKKGYIGMGGDISGYRKDFWEYDPSSNTWTQKSDFAGVASQGLSGFSIAEKGYVGTGWNGIYNKKFWEYDPEMDIWTPKADFGGSARDGAVGFSIGNKGYIGTGRGPYTTWNKDFWEYDPSTNVWIQKADFGGTPRQHAKGFSIGSKGYIGTGLIDFSNTNVKDFWEYDPGTNTWIQKANFGGTSRHVAVGISIGSKGYIGVGWNGSNSFSDFWEYTPDGSDCAVPTNLSSTNITATTAKLNWNAINNAIFYKVSFKKTGTSEWKTIKTITNSKTLHELAPNTEYTWKVKSLCSLQPTVASEWSEKLFFTTAPLRLANESVEPSIAVYPNPLTSSATILFDLTDASSVAMELIDVNGRTVTVIAKEEFPSGNHEITFDRGALAAGIYLLQLKTDEGVMMKKLVIE